MIVELAQIDIDRAKRLAERWPRQPSLECPVACALKRATGRQWCVGPMACYPVGDLRAMRHLPADATRAVDAWDKWDRLAAAEKRETPCPVVPLTFDLPEPTLPTVEAVALAPATVSPSTAPTTAATPAPGRQQRAGAATEQQENLFGDVPQ